jgi:hypothetical protein
VGVELVVVEGGRGVAVSRVVVVDVDVCSVWMAAVGMVNISGTTLSFASANVTNGPCAASQYINPCFLCLYFSGMSQYFVILVITTFNYN